MINQNLNYLKYPSNVFKMPHHGKDKFKKLALIKNIKNIYYKNKEEFHDLLNK